MLRKVLFGHKVQGGMVAVIGYLLSPLSWWNDLFINIPLAYLFALVAGLVSQKFFVPAMVLGYWLTNIVGLIMLHKGMVRFADKTTEHRYTKMSFFKDIGVSLLYTLFIVLLIYFKIIKFPAEYFTF